MNNIPYKEIMKTLGVFVLGFIIILAVSKTISVISDKPFNETRREDKTVECPLDSKSFEDTKTNKSLVLLENKMSYGIDGSFDNRIYTVKLKRTGLNSQIACGYLSYRINVGNKPIDKEHEGLYMIPTNSRQFGGHILPDEKNAISINDTATSTEFLIPLNNINYDGTSRINIKQVNWVSLLNVASEIDFDIALNTIRPLGNIYSVEIAYKCWNPQTGQETSDCNLEIVQ